MSRRAAVGLGLDALLVLVFVLIGRRSHDEDSALLGLLGTWWPFLAGLGAGWLIARAWRAPDRLLPTGAIVWVSTVALGMLLRAASGQGVQLSFVIVTTIVLGVFLLGRRAVSARIARSRSTSSDAE